MIFVLYILVEYIPHTKIIHRRTDQKTEWELKLKGLNATFYLIEK